ncbi:MAG: ECF transporter S component [Spirochaetales bacterium]|nr:ECF transporter S component [Spirochaetales bacterium]
MTTSSGVYIRKLVVTGALGALAIFLGITRLGIFPWISGASLTILHIPAIIGAILEGPVVGAGIGAIFGAFSFFQASTSPASPIDFAFRNPLVSLLPRILFPILTWAIFYFGSKIKILPAVVVASVAGTIIHTILVLTMLVVTAGSGVLTGGADGVTLWAVIWAIFIANGFPEAVAAGIFTTLVVAAKMGISSKRNTSRLTDEIKKN